MPWTEQDVFDDEYISAPSVILSEYEFQFKDISTRVRVRIYREIKPPSADYSFRFESSHYIHTPIQAGPYITSQPWATTQGEALHRAVDGLLSHYKHAIQSGHQPDKSWLIENMGF